MTEQQYREFKKYWKDWHEMYDNLSIEDKKDLDERAKRRTEQREQEVADDIVSRLTFNLKHFGNLP